MALGGQWVRYSVTAAPCAPRVMKTLMRNGRDRRSENPSLGHAKQERVSLFGTDQRITSGPAARRPHSKAEYMTAPERFADSQIPLAPRAPSIHGPSSTDEYRCKLPATNVDRQSWRSS